MIPLDRVKACSRPDCREVLPADPLDDLGAGFWASRREGGPGSRVLRYQSWCRKCERAASRERMRAKRTAEREGVERRRASVRSVERDGRTILLRTCLGPCGRELECGDGPESGFGVAARSASGRPAAWHSWCRECERIRAKEWRDAHKDEVNARRRADHAKRMLDPEYREARRLAALEVARRAEADPERRARRRAAARKWQLKTAKEAPELRRMDYRLRAERQGRKVRERGLKVIDGTRPEVPAAPFMEWLAAYQRATGLFTAAELAPALGLDERNVRRLLVGGKVSVSVDVVSRALTEARGVVAVDGRTVVTFDDLYSGQPLNEKRRPPRDRWPTIEEYQAERRARRRRQ